jgi:anaerobic selenocysteine-containing dehydrogenase
LVGMRSADQVIKTVCVHCVNFCAIEVHKVGGVIRSIRPDPARRDVYKADNPAKLIWQHGQGST